MFISEIFHSLQGEGILLGVPSVFIRTSGCNLRCQWCDTPYASWKPEGKSVSIDTIVARVAAFHCRHVVLTGGEPMIADGLPELAARLRQEGHHITIETAATVMPKGIACDLGSLSPKLANSTPDVSAGAWRERHEQRRYQPEVIRAWLALVDCQLKFVVTSADDLTEIEALLQEVGEVPRDRVLLMPEGTDVETLRKRSPAIAQLCRERGYRFAPRLHIELYGNTRGT
ncbi:MAG: radical SAM protein [Verrucomicrobia bacterium RIFCSPHIGHO2_12_FULL_41_10]|nr:MAG: radical SAM protein [Verrucomicrobia bacterium RIFCSPHIGHO2_12_FULL_41_10]HLB33994.1 7-carboxy-7-deazaguanine synthase QueE [Chthoniobacterales bacterium]